MNAVETRELTKKYGQKTAVDGLSLTVKEGELYALLGVNGAGKTTIIKMLSCLCAPTSGECFVCGNNCTSQSANVKRIIGVSPQDTAIAENLTVRENLALMCGIHGIKGGEKRAKIDEMIEKFGMEKAAESHAKTLSGGWKRRLSIAMALVSEPKVLFLDEPTLGLDVLARRDLWEIISALKGRTTIILTTHYMEEAQRLSDRICVMINGKIAACGTSGELETLTGESGLENAFVKIVERHNLAKGAN